MPDLPTSKPAAADLKQTNPQAANFTLQKRLRPVTTAALATIDNTGNLSKGAHLGAEGTVTFFLGRTADAIARVQKAISSADPAAINAIVKEVTAPLPKPPADLNAAYDAIAAAPVFVSVLYGGTTLVDGLMVPEGRDLVALTLPYIGGRLAPGGLQLRQWQKTGAALLHGTAVLTAPKLTPAEAAAVQQPGDSGAWRNIGTHNDCDGSCTAAAASGALEGALAGAAAGGFIGSPVGAVAGAVAGAFAGAAAGQNALNWLTHQLGGSLPLNQADAEQVVKTMQFSDADVQKLGAQGTAGALMELRRMVLQQPAK